MSYTNATFYIDYESGSDTARTSLTSVAVANNGSGFVRCTKTAHGLVTGAVGTASLNYAGPWKITVIDANNFDLVSAVYSTATALTFVPFGGSSKADAWQTVSTGATAARHAAGDTIRIKASPDPTSLGINGTWTDGPQQTTKAIVSSTNATPIVVTLSSGNYTLLAPAVGDTIIVNGHTTNTKANGVWTISAVNGSTTITLQDALGANSVGNGSGGASGTVRKVTNAVVKLASALTKNIALCGNQGTKTNWTAATADITNTVVTTDFKEGGECQQIAIAAAFTTGLAAYFPTGTLDLSSYQQVSFWIKQTAGTLGSPGAVCLKLCTDTAGATPVHTFSAPGLGALNVWTQVVVDLGSNMNSAIASVAFVLTQDNAAQTFLLDNIVACKASSSADSLNLTSLISKNTGSEAWFGIQSINGTRVMLDALVNTIPAASPQRGYSGTTETVTTYKRETIKTVCAAVVGTHVQPTQLAGAAGSPITYSGGWNRTDMTTQTGETWWDGQNGLGYGLSDNAAIRTYLSFDKINFTRYNIGFGAISTGSTYLTIGSMAASSCTSTPISFVGAFGTATTLTAVQNGGAMTLGPAMVTTTVARADGNAANGVTVGTASMTTTITQANNNSSAGVAAANSSIIGTITAAHGNGSNGYAPAASSVCGSATVNSNTNYGIAAGIISGAKVLGGSSTGNALGGVAVNNVGGGSLTLRNFTANEGTPFVIGATAGGGMIYSEKNGGVTDAHLITSDGGTIASATDQRHTASGISWKFRPTSTNRNSAYPLTLSVAKIACAANALVTVSIWTYRDSLSIQGRLRLPANQLAGIGTTDITVACTPAQNTWTQSSTLTFTPTEAGVVEVFFDVWDGVSTTSNMWIDDLVLT